LKLLYKAAFWTSVFAVIAIIAEFGFPLSAVQEDGLRYFYLITLGLGVLSTIMRYLEYGEIKKRSVFIFDLVSVVFTLLLFYIFILEGDLNSSLTSFKDPVWLKAALFLSFIREFSEVKLNYKRTVLNPAQLFVLSFLSLIILGTFLLMLPNATRESISFIDALFTSTSAVCVTGLIVVDTGSYFTQFGQIVIMLLFQIGGIGILTVASYFSYFIKGGSSYESQLVLSDLTNSNKMSSVFSTLRYIIVITFSIELVAGILIYSSLDMSNFQTYAEKLFFSIFYAISALRNAGFSTLSNSVYQEGFRYNYLLQLSIIFTFIMGGLGFPIVANLIKYVKYRFQKLINYNKRNLYRPWVLNINSRITLITTLTITAIATIIFYCLEYDNTLAEHHGIGKFITALFGAATPRTAGFNSVDTSALLFPTTMMVFLLMWIGASPSSTGGGIKTSTFAVATLNILSLAKGKDRIEVFRRTISDRSVKRAFAVISLSLIVIGMGIMLISIFDNEKSLMDISFECFSAYSTVGLSLGITSSLSTISKFIISVIMFVGRVSMLTIMIALFKRVKHTSYQYPTEEIMIN
jgi:Trk-type K+ transport system membrane component